jgi:hypothetical protein
LYNSGMTINEYQTITGTTVASADVTRVTAQITRAQRVLETLIGFTLDPAHVNDNQYDEIGKTAQECPCPLDLNVDDLDAPDAVVKAYRTYIFNKRDGYIAIDPASTVHAVKLVKDGVTFRTLDPDEYRVEFVNGFTKYIKRCEDFCFCVTNDCYCTQLAVDATWLWDGTTSDIPDDLLQIWAEMTTFYSDLKQNIKSQTLGSHSYTKFDKTPPEKLEHNLAVIKNYAGPNGSATQNPVW